MCRWFFTTLILVLGLAQLTLAQDVILSIVSASGEAFVDINPRDEDNWWIFLQVKNTTPSSVTLNALDLKFSFDNRYLSVSEVTTDNTEVKSFTFSYDLKTKGNITTIGISLADTTGTLLAASGGAAIVTWLKLNPNQMHIDVKYPLMVKGEIYDGTAAVKYKREDTGLVYCDTLKGDNSGAGPLANPVTSYDVLMVSRQVVGLEDYIGDSVLLKDIMDTNADGEIDSQDVFHSLKKAADSTYEMPADVSGAHPAPAIGQADLAKKVLGNPGATCSFWLTSLERVEAGRYLVYLETNGLPSEPIGVDVDFQFAPDLRVKIEPLEFLKEADKANAVQTNTARLVFSQPQAFKENQGQLAKIEIETPRSGELPEFSLVNVLINEGKIPVRWLTQRVLTPLTKLLPNYPNPFNPETWIPFQLAERTEILIAIYNIYGRLVRSLDLGHKEAGYYLNKDKAAYWDGRDSNGERVASGLYFYTIRAGNLIKTRRMVMVK